MRMVLALATALATGALVLGLGTASASAAPLPSVATVDAASSAVETIGWQRRYYRRYGTVPYAPPPVAGEDIIVEDDAVVVVPLRPLSCGEFRYWNGTACVDARYNTPYLGPR